MRLDKEWIKKWEPCVEGVKWLKKQDTDEAIVILKRLIEKEKKYDWANWAIVRCMTYNQYVAYAVYVAEQVIHIYEKENPEDKRPREAIDAAKRCFNNDSKENRSAAAWAESAARAAWAAAKAAMRRRILKYGLELLKNREGKGDNIG